MEEHRKKESEDILDVLDDQVEQLHEYAMECIAPDGLGYGQGAISAQAREASPEHPVSREQLLRAIDVIMQNKSSVIVPVQESDDGCGDGRPTGTIQQINPETGELVTYNVSHRRAKIFGGGLQVAASMWRAVVGEALHGETVLGDREFIAKQLKERGISYGAHTDTHAEGDNCGCGAIDKYPLSTTMTNADKFGEQIVATVGAFIENAAENSSVQRALDTRAKISKDVEYMSNASGKQTLELIKNDGAVIKELEAGHLEAIVIMNEEPGTTVDQEKVAALLKEAGLPGGIQVFVVDVWRGRMYAEAVAEMAAEQNGYDAAEARETALADFFINQLSVAATLTDGTLPVIYNRTTV